MRTWGGVRRRHWIALALLALLIAASISVHPPRTLRVGDPQGQPLAAIVAYRYQGSAPNFVHPVTYDAGAIALRRGDADGRVGFPFAVHAHWPFPIQTHPSLRIEMLYVPALHNAISNLGDVSKSQANVFAYDAADRRVVVYDVRDQPAMWEGTLNTVSSMIQRVVPKPFRPDARLSDRDPVTADLALELIDHFRREYDAFLARYLDTALPPPVRPQMFTDDEKRRWAEMVAANLKIEPTWGARVTRLYHSYSSMLREYEAELR